MVANEIPEAPDPIQGQWEHLEPIKMATMPQTTAMEVLAAPHLEEEAGVVMAARAVLQFKIELIPEGLLLMEE